MSSDLISMIAGQLAGPALEGITKQLGGGANQQQTSGALEMAIPILMKALAGNTTKSGGADALANALDKDHDGSILEDLPGFINNFSNGPGGGILKHVLGNKRGTIESLIGSQTGLQGGQAGNILEIAAPIVLGMLGKQKRTNGLNAGGIADMLGQVSGQVQQQAPKEMGLVGKLLDSDGDGDIKDDLAKIGMNLLGGLFRK